MSAITGIYHFTQEPIPTEHGLTLMSGLQQFPSDSIHTWRNEHVFLGCHAQYITPESAHELLPYYDTERQLVITADAIIDNRESLFQLLQIDYGRRSTITDSELILLAYDKWEENAPQYLVGDFAFMIWDLRNGRLFGARDFSGSRTLYYYHDHQRFAFCTTIQPLLSLPYTKTTLNEQWLAEYLAIIGMVDVVDASTTVYRDIAQLPPSHSITIAGSKVTLKRYCTLTSRERLKLKSNEEYIEAFQEVYQEAVTSRLRTNRQVGAQLSGGLDSGSIVSFAVKELSKSGKTLHTFSYVPPSDFEDFTPAHILTDERPFIQSIVKHVGGMKDSYEDFAGRDPYTEMDSFLSTMEMPYKFFENSFWLKGMFEKAQEANVGVLLNGGRGNLSISWGSAIDYYATLLKRLQWVRLAQELHSYSKNVGGARLRRLPDVARTAFPIMDRLFPTSEPFAYPMLINPDFAKKTDVFNKLKQHGMDQSGWFSSPNLFEQRKSHFEELFHWNASNTLATKLSLNYGIWKRDPTNDLRVIRFCLSLPEEQYVQNGLDRALIRRATKTLLPDNVRLNQSIRGVQGADWVHRMIPHQSALLVELDEMSADPTIFELLNGPVIRRAIDKVRAGLRPEDATNAELKFLMRGIVVYRFLKKWT
ncbi:lasso peptide isopeptide bond-forming cyclase [Paenibacillus sp. UNC451MF]|uniref:lasso peptide isopeptide bond-forming cyclase n=1 Tax=Paenibacillus sp. UNC451MF TaxID=1449063 RepID=UPI00048E61F9|nr:lasso peptide isopeptide bond-forming cyclase [Paenibacillus sp. UNC451MF]